MNYSYLLLPAVQTKKLDVVKAAVGTAVLHRPQHDFINDADSRGITALALASIPASIKSLHQSRCGARSGPRKAC